MSDDNNCQGCGTDDSKCPRDGCAHCCYCGRKLDVGMGTREFAQDGTDNRTHRTYVGTVVSGSDKNGPFCDIDHGFQVSEWGHKSHVWTDSSCWLKDLKGKRVRMTIDVLND
jgi:hypothetical protein